MVDAAPPPGKVLPSHGLEAVKDITFAARHGRQRELEYRIAKELLQSTCYPSAPLPFSGLLVAGAIIQSMGSLVRETGGSTAWFGGSYEAISALFRSRSVSGWPPAPSPASALWRQHGLSAIIFAFDDFLKERFA
ncbi:MAG: hypothetical protein M1826_007167 [Phylliscum demangeonii]|nr:MAG: hypothetical protein M1826_007167 [Phylliscum demangeonii]